MISKTLNEMIDTTRIESERRDLLWWEETFRSASWSEEAKLVLPEMTFWVNSYYIQGADEYEEKSRLTIDFGEGILLSVEKSRRDIKWMEPYFKKFIK